MSGDSLIDNYRPWRNIGAGKLSLEWVGFGNVDL